MGLKEVLQSLIAMKQEEMPFKLLPRDLKLPVDSQKIITVPGVRRCGKSSLLMLAVNELINRGVEKNRILWLSFDDERIYDLKRVICKSPWIKVDMVALFLPQDVAQL